jgi:hypothetical protein
MTAATDAAASLRVRVASVLPASTDTDRDKPPGGRRAVTAANPCVVYIELQQPSTGLKRDLVTVIGVADVEPSRRNFEGELMWQPVDPLRCHLNLEGDVSVPHFDVPACTTRTAWVAVESTRASPL